MCGLRLSHRPSGPQTAASPVLKMLGTCVDRTRGRSDGCSGHIPPVPTGTFVRSQRGFLQSQFKHHNAGWVWVSTTLAVPNPNQARRTLPVLLRRAVVLLQPYQCSAIRTGAGTLGSELTRSGARRSRDQEGQTGKTARGFLQFHLFF